MNIEVWKMAEAGEVELAAVVALMRAARARLAPAESHTAVASRAVLQDWLAAPRTAALIARGAGTQVYGVLVMRGEGEGVVRLVFLAAAPRRKGIGTRLIGALRKVAAKRGARELRVTCDLENPEHVGFFVEHHGFQRRGEPAAGGREVELALAI